MYQSKKVDSNARHTAQHITHTCADIAAKALQSAINGLARWHLTSCQCLDRWSPERVKFGMALLSGKLHLLGAEVRHLFLAHDRKPLTTVLEALSEVATCASC